MQPNPGTTAAGDRLEGLDGLYKYNEMTSSVRIELHTLDPDIRCITFSQWTRVVSGKSHGPQVDI